MMPAILAQLKILLASLATIGISITPAMQQTVQTNANTTAVNVGSNGTSRNWAGYVAGNGTYTSVSGTWTVPQPTESGHTSSDATWVGIGGVSSNDLIQSGTQNIVGPSGQLTTTAFYELLPDISVPITSVTVNPGDSVTTTITQQSSPDQWLITLKDNTNGGSYQNTVTYTSSTSSAEWIEEAPSNGQSVLPLDNFGTIQFSDGATTQNGTSVSIADSNAQTVTMVNSAGQALAGPSSLGSDGSSFSVTRTSAISSAPIPSFDHNPHSWRRHGEGIGSGFHFIRRSRINNNASQPSVTPFPTWTPKNPSATSSGIHSFRFSTHRRFDFKKF